MSYATVNPYTGETLKTFPEATDAEVAAAIASAHSAFLQWRKTSFGERAKILQKAADLLRAGMDTPVLSAALQVVLGGVLVFLTGLLIGNA